MRLTLPYPPSVNKYWVRTKHGGQMLSAEARAYKLKVLCASPHPRQRFTCDVAVWLDVYRPRRIGDLDNIQKAIFDALKGIAYRDDSQVAEIHARRFDDKHNPRVEVRVEGKPAIEIEIK